MPRGASATGNPGAHDKNYRGKANYTKTIHIENLNEDGWKKGKAEIKPGQVPEEHCEQVPEESCQNIPVTKLWMIDVPLRIFLVRKINNVNARCMETRN